MDLEAPVFIDIAFSDKLGATTQGVFFDLPFRVRFEMTYNALAWGNLSNWLAHVED